jgi:hypothetical protein
MTTTTQKWATFTYYFYHKPVKNDRPRDRIANQHHHPEVVNAGQKTSGKYAQSGVYKLTCPDCNKAYVGQTNRSFVVRFDEHKNAFKTNSHTSNFASTSSNKHTTTP